MSERAGVIARLADRARDRRSRLICYGVAAAILALLCLFPRPYVARALIVPQEPSASLANSFGGGRLEDLTALFGGGRRGIDLYLSIGRSADIRGEVIQELRLVGSSWRYATFEDADVRLQRHVDVQSLPGGVLEIEVDTHDRDEALKLTRAFTQAIARHLRELNSEKVKIRQQLLDNRFREASARLALAQGSLNDFRRRNRLSAAPEAELGSAIAVRAGIEANLQAKLVQLQTLRQVLGPDNPRLSTAEVEVRGLREQLARATRPADSAGGPNAGGLTELSTQYLDRYRDYLFAQSLYQVYARLAEQVAVEDVSGRNAPTIQVIETPHIEQGLHINVSAAAALALLVLIALFTEVYAPATGIDLWRRRDLGPAR